MVSGVAAASERARECPWGWGCGGRLFCCLVWGALAAVSVSGVLVGDCDVARDVAGIVFVGLVGVGAWTVPRPDGPRCWPCVLLAGVGD
jgi:hypothetical protein